ncbi:protein Shroom1 isoform 1-T1 [Mantella aurantiaca]
MSSISNAIDEWSTRSTSGISALRHQLISGDFPDRLTPVNAMAAIVDSAYSSFSGSSYVADYQTSFKHDICHLNNEQLSYMDSEYVKAIYNPSVIEYNHLQQHLHCDDSKEDANNGPGDHLSHKTKRSPTSNSSLCLPEHKISRNQGHSPPWVRNSVHNKLSQPCVVSVNMEEGSYQPHLPSSKFLDPSKDRMALKEVSSTCNENYHGSQTDESNKDCFQGIDSHTGKPFSVEIEEHAHKNRFDSAVDNPQKEGKTSKSTRRSWNEFVSVKLRGYKKKAGSWKPAKETNCCEGTKSEVEKLALNQQQKEQYHQNIKDMEFDNLEKCEIKYKHPHIKTSQTVYSEHSDDLCELPLKLLNCDDLHDIPKAHNLRKDATIKPIPLLSQKQEARPQISNCCDLPSEKITKALTPMLYHLAGGNNSSLAMMNTSQQTRPLDTNEECDAFQNKGHFAEPQVAEPQQPLHKTKSQLQLDENFENEFNDCDTTGGLTCSAEESFMLDYREKLKIAQKKVLRATSFKRRDLQMSLPIRLKLNPPKRSLVDHIRSYSLSSQNEEAKLAQPNISVDKGHKKDEPEKATVLRIGGRKRLTKEQRKLCYSEPEKLDHLGIHNSGLAWNSDGSVQNKSGDHYRMKSLDKERTLSSSNVSKIELKQIQHNALVEYMERKANRRPSSIHQSHVQKTGGTQSSPEWKTNETLCSDENLIHHHRRSTGASSSYDATVTWNDRYLKMSTLGEQTRSADTMGETTSYFDQCTLDNSKGYSNESSTSGYQERIKNSVGHIFTSGQQCNDDDSKIRLCVMGDHDASERENGFKAKSRGKSMEELGTSDKTKLSVLSQSSDQIYHINVSTLIPWQESTSGITVLHPDKLQACAEHESGKQPRQISQEDFLESHRADIGKLAQAKHSRSQRTSGVSPENYGSNPPSQFYPTAAEILPCRQVEDDVFNGMQKQNAHYTAQDNTPLQSSLPVHVNMQKASLEPSDEALPGNGNEVSDDVNDLYEGSAVGESPYLNAEDRDTEAVSKRIKSTDFQSMSSIQQEDLDLSGQVITQKASSEGYDDHSWNNGLTRQEMDSMQERRDSATEDLTGPRLKTSAEERCAELVREIVSKDKSLVDILKSFPGRAPAISLMKSLFHVDISLLEKCQNWRLQKDKINVEGMSKSHSKTMLLLQRMSDECLNEITSKKVELISIINSQLEELFAQRESLLAEISDNTTQGTNLEVVVKEVCKPNEYERYMMFIGDLEKVVSLLFCLTTRLARVENALSRTDENTDTDEMQSLKERHSLLSRQSEDAKDLKDNLDRREQVVTGILAKYLSEGQLEDYKHYVRLKTYFLIEQKDLEEKIKFHEEQLESLHNSIPP